MASTEANIDMDLIRKTAMCVKQLEVAAEERDYNNFLAPAKDLSENVVKLVHISLQYNLADIAAELKERVKQAMAEAKTLLREKSDQCVDRFKSHLRQVAKVLVALMNEFKQIKTSTPQSAPLQTTGTSNQVRHFFFHTIL